MVMRNELLTRSFRVLLFDEIEEYEEAIAQITEHLKSNQSNACAFNNRGLAYSETGRGEEALRDFAKAIACSTTDPIPYVNRGDLYLRHKPDAKINEAIDDFTRAIAIRKDATIHRCRAHACLKGKRLREAIKSLSRAIQLEQDFRQTWIDRGQAYKELGEEEKAESDFRFAETLPAFPKL